MKTIRYPLDEDLSPGEVQRVIGLELTRRNLLSLLAKLDEPDSARTLFKGSFFVTAVEDEAHYADRKPGPMSESTEAAIRKARS